MPFIEPVARDAPERVFVSTRMSELAFLLCRVIVLTGTKDRDVLSQLEIYVNPIH